VVRLTDPGKGLTPDQALAARLQAWRRPTTKAARQKLRQERVAAAREAMRR
jgi:hypothetical protein